MSPLTHSQKPHNLLSFSRWPSVRGCLRLAALCLIFAVSARANADTALPENKITPAFTLKDVDGVSHTSAEYRGRPVVVCFACGCTWCHDFGVQWAQMQQSGVLTDAVAPKDPNAPAPDKPPITLVVFMGDAAATRAYAAAVGLDLKQTVLLPDADDRVTRLYHALPCPRLYVLDGSGLLRYVNSHADDKPQKASATVLVAKTISGLRRTTLPPPAPAKTTPNPTKKPAPKTGDGGNHGK